MDTLLYIANGLYLASYTVRDILHLRLLSVTAAACLVGYFASRPDPLVAVIAWNLVFLALNLVHIGLLLGRRRRSSGQFRNFRKSSGNTPATTPAPRTSSGYKSSAF